MVTRLPVKELLLVRVQSEEPYQDIAHVSRALGLGLRGGEGSTSYPDHIIRVRLRGVMPALDAGYAGFDSQNSDHVAL